MPINLFLHCMLIASLLIGHSDSLKIIAAPLLPISPAFDIMSVAAELHSRGHEVLVVVADSALDFMKTAAARHTSNTTADGLRYVTVNLSFQEFERPKPLKLGEVPKPSRFAIPDRWPQSLWFRLTSGIHMLRVFQPGVRGVAHQLLGNVELMQTLRDFRADAWMSVGLSLGSIVHDTTGCLLCHALGGGVQLLDVSGNAFFSGPPTAPQFGTLLTPQDLKTLPGMALNLATWALQQLMPLWTDQFPSPTDKVRQQYGLPWAASPSWLSEGLRRVRGIKTQRCVPAAEVVLSSWLVEYPRALPATKVLVGSGTARPAHPLTTPPDVATFVNTATQHGLVLAAFGTVYGATLRPEDLHELAKGFAAVAPVRVLWALKDSALRPGIDKSDLPLGSNTLVVPWVDYNDVLGHPNTCAFVSHCGAHSVNEAAYHGVPLIALPFQMEQAENALKLVSRGAAVICRQSPAYRRGSAAAEAITFTASSIAGHIRQVMAPNSSYAAAASAIGAALQRYAAQRHPYQRAADEVELAVMGSKVKAAATATVASEGVPAAVGVPAGDARVQVPVPEREGGGAGGVTLAGPEVSEESAAVVNAAGVQHEEL